MLRYQDRAAAPPDPWAVRGRWENGAPRNAALRDYQ
jgi:hypothetical protein